MGYYVKLRLLRYNFELDSPPLSGGSEVKKNITTLAVGVVY
jgi:hypothetical protein